MYELQVDFYNEELVVMVFGIVTWIFSIVVVNVECVWGQLLDQYEVLLVVDQQVLVEVDQQVMVEEQVLVNQVVQLKITWP